MKKRWFAASLAALMALSMTACGGGKAAETTAAPAETKAEAAASEANGEKKEEAAAATEELVAEDGAEIEVAYWEGSTSDKEAWDELLDTWMDDADIVYDKDLIASVGKDYVKE